MEYGSYFIFRCRYANKRDLIKVYITPMSDDSYARLRGIYEFTMERVGTSRNYKYFNSGFTLMNLNYLIKRNSVSYILDAFLEKTILYQIKMS